MPQLQPITVNDSDSNPVTFTPRAISDGIGVLVNTTGVPIGDRKVTISSRSAGNKYKSRLVLTIPTVANETINGVTVPKVSRTAYADLQLTFEPTSTLEERENALAIVASALAADQTLVQGVLVGLEGVY